MTPREGDALTFITDYLARHNGVSPTLSEIGTALGIISRGAVHVLVSSVERQGHIRREPGRRRNIALARRLDGFTSQELLAELERRDADPAWQRVAACECGNRADTAEARDCQRDICPMRAPEILDWARVSHAHRPTAAEGAR